MFSFKAIFDAFAMINSIMMPTGNLGISRQNMPQIDGVHQGDFVRWLLAKGIKTVKKNVPASSLQLTQNEVNKMKVFKLMQLYREGSVAKWAPVIISRDNFVIDGSHRFLAVYNVNKFADVEVLKVDMDAVKLVQLCLTFPKVKHRTHSDAKVQK